MSLPISTAAALGVARVATRAVQGTVQATVEAARDFAGVLGESVDMVGEVSGQVAGNEPAVAINASAEDHAEAEESLQALVEQWMRRFGLNGDEPVQVSMDTVNERVRIRIPDATGDQAGAVVALENRINDDLSIRQTVLDFLRQLPGQTFDGSH